MSTTTTNYGLTKPAGTEYQDVAVLNTDFDTIDTELKRVDDAAAAATTRLTKVAFAEAAGQTSLDGSSVAAGSSVNVAVTFPNGRFSVAPRVVVGMTTAPGGSAYNVPRALNVTTTGFTLYVYNTASNAQTWTGLVVDWHAIQMASGAASG